MKPIEALFLDLKSSDSKIRDTAALELMNIASAVAISPLIEAIAKPENVNHRGTLVYALSAFDCLEHLEFLVDLVLTGNFEVSTGAFGIINDAKLSTESIQRVEMQMQKYNRDQLPFEHGAEAYEALAQVITSNNSGKAFVMPA